MKLRLVILALAVLPIVSCATKEEDPFKIDADRVGKLLKSARESEIDSVFAADSIVRDSSEMSFGSVSKYRIFEKGGAALLTLNVSTDSLTRIETVQVLDKRYKTAEGIGLESTFGEIQKAYEIKKIVTTMNNVVIFLKGKDFYFTISRDQLPGSLRFNPNLEIEAIQIPEKAEVKYMMVGWD